MKKTLLVAAMFALQGCGFGVNFRVDLLQELRDSVGVKTNLPFGRNAVFVSAPLSVAKLTVIKADQFTPPSGVVVAVIAPGNGIAVPFSGLFSDQRMTIFVTAHDAEGKLIGTRSRIFTTYDSGNSGTIDMWEVTSSELQSR